MTARSDTKYRTWRRQRRPWAKIKPNDDAMHAYEEAMILADCRRLSGPICAKDLRRLEPGRYSIKLSGVLKRMAASGLLKPLGAQRCWDRIRPTYALPDSISQAMSG